jgi:hypothetical protein
MQNIIKVKLKLWQMQGKNELSLLQQIWLEDEQILNLDLEL